MVLISNDKTLRLEGPSSDVINFSDAFSLKSLLKWIRGKTPMAKCSAQRTSGDVLKATSKNVIPVKTGIQKPLTSLDSRLRGSDKLIIIRGPLKLFK